jgi:hypothetical protein
VAARQDGVFTRAQARAAGLSKAQVEYRLRSGAFKTVAGDVLTLASTPAGIRQGIRAAALTWPDGIVWGLSAARFWFPSAPIPPSDVVFVAVPHGRQDRFRLVARRHRVSATDTVTCGGARIQTAASSLLVTLAELDRPAADSLVAWLIARRQFPVAQFEAALARRITRNKAGRLREYAQMAAAGAASRSEVALQALLIKPGIVGWVANAEVRGADGSIASADALFLKERLIVAVDGRAYHSDPDAFQRDRSQQNQLVNAGYRFLRFTWADLTERPELVVEQITRALNRG